MELNLGLAEESLIVASIVTERLLIASESFFVFLLNVSHLTKNEVESRPQLLYILAVSWKIAPLRASLVFENLQTRFAQFCNQCIIFLQEVVLSEVVDAKRVPWIGLESLLEVCHRLLSHFKIVHIRSDLDNSSCRQSHRVSRIQFNRLVHAQLGLWQVAEAIVAKTDTEPDVGGTPWVIVHHLLQESQTLLSVASRKLDYCSCDHQERFNRGGRVTLCHIAALRETCELFLTMLVVV